MAAGEPSSADIRKELFRVAGDYPERFRARILGDIARQQFHLEVVLRGLGAGATVVDIGGGTSLFAPGCAAVGLNAVLVDDFMDFGDPEITAARDQMFRDVHEPLGVRVVHRDVVADGLSLEPESADGITSFAAIEHFHHSPKRLLGEMTGALKPGGLFLLGAPNCVNLRKRLTVPLGHGKWSSMQDWYERETFRGHVREPDVADLLYIARDLELRSARVYGRNWIGLTHTNPLIRRATPIFDRLLRLRPALCSDIYVAARKS